MNSVVEKLDEIEVTAQAIVERAQEQKTEIERELQNARDRFDRELEEKTSREIAEVQKDGERRMNRILEGQREKNQSVLQNLKNEFEENHAIYAETILKHIIEV